jgi:predicted phosphate transport protein (TIGR00153 family)
MSLIGDLFGRSPIRPLQKHMGAAVNCAREVMPFVEAMAAGDRAAMERHRAEIVRLEHEADEIKHELRSNLPKRLFLAVERRDMLEILEYQDSIADVAQDIAELADMRGMTAPEPLRDVLLVLTREVILVCEKAEEMINELDELLETGFGARETERVDEMIVALGVAESETDRLAEEALKVVFSMEDELGVGTYFWYRMIGWIGDMADYAEKVGNRLRLLIAS